MKVIFLDRDGTVIREPADERVDTENKIELFPDTIESLSYLAQHDFSVILITNQAGIAEGRITVSDFERIHTKVLELLKASDVKVLKTYMCPHGPGDMCDCRKPSPKMILEAIKEFNLQPENLYMVGDRESDIKSGISAGVKTILLQTATVPVIVEKVTYVSPTLLDAAKYVVAN